MNDPVTADDALLAAERLRQVVEFAPNALVLVDRAGRITLVNAEAERLFGYERAELLGQPVELLVPDRYRAGHPAHRDGFFGNPHAGDGSGTRSVRAP